MAEALEPTQELRRVRVDPHHFSGLVGDGHLNQLVQLLVDAALEQLDQPSPGNVGTAAAAQLLDLAELVEGVLELLLDLIRRVSSTDFAVRSATSTMASSFLVRDCSVAKSASMTLRR